MIVLKISIINVATKYVCSSIKGRMSIDTCSDKYVYTSIELQLRKIKRYTYGFLSGV